MEAVSKYIFWIGIIFIFSCGRKIIDKSNPNFKNRISVELSDTKKEDKEIVIEGTVISSNRGFFQNTIFSSCVVEINTIFKGEIEEKVIEIFVMGGSLGEISVSMSHGQIILPQLNTTAIFRIKELEENNPQKELMTLTPYKLFYGIAEVKMLFPLNSYNNQGNIEKEIYQKLEIEFNRKREKILPPKTVDEIAIKYSAENRQLLPNRKTGIVYKLNPIHETKKVDFLGFNLHISSANSATYLHKGELIIEYDNEAFGDSIVTKGDLIYDIPRNYKINNGSRSNAIPKHFEVKITDIDSNKFKIQWINQNTLDSCIQLLPQNKGIYAAQLYFTPKQIDKPAKIKLKSEESKNLMYDYLIDKIIPYEYVVTEEIQYFRIMDLMPSTITDISPNKIFQPTDTVFLIGKNFGQYSKISLYSKGTRGHKRYRKIPESYILNRSDTLVQLIIPPLVLRNKEYDLSDEWVPTSGKIKMTKGYGKFEVNTWSKEQIKIKNTAPNKAYNGK